MHWTAGFRLCCIVDLIAPPPVMSNVGRNHTQDLVFINQTMKKSIALVIAASTLLLAGCSSTHHAAKQWEYKVALTPIGPEGTRPVGIERREQFLN